MSFQKQIFIILLFILLLVFTPSVGFTITLDNEIKQAQILIEELRNVTPGTKAADQVAMKIMHNYQCKKLLKSSEYSDIGATFHDLIYGNNGIAQRTLNKAKAKLAENQKYQSLSDRVESIRNKSSEVAKKPPMDLDFGVLAKDNDDLKRILTEIKKNGGNVSEFHEVLQQALEDSFKEVGESLDLPVDAINAKTAFIAGTTGFHPEAYKDVGAIKGDTPLKDWVSQSVDVSRYKIDELQHLVEEGLISAESAAQEAARGTLKDLDKLDRTFTSIAERTGKKPTLSAVNDKLRILLQELVDANDPQTAQDVLVKINELTNGRNDIFSACNNLIDNMEAGWKLTSGSDPELLFKKLMKDLLPEADFNKALKALEDSNLNDLPVSFQNLRKKIFNLAAAKRTSLSRTTVEELIKQFEGNRMLSGIKGDTRQVLIELIEQLDLVDDPKLFNTIFGEQLGVSFKKIKDLLTDSVKGSLIKRLAKRIPLKTLDGKWTSLELGDSGSALGADAFIGIAMTYNDINNIMDKNLSPEEENRELQKAVVSNMPIVGDFMMSINTGVDAYYEGDYSKGAQSAAYLVIGIGGMVPGAQIPALIAGLGMATAQIGGMAWDAHWDRKLVQSWEKSGVWDEEKGILLGIKNSKGETLKIDFESLVGNFTEKYMHDYDDMEIRDSIFYYTEKHLLKGNKTIETFKLALKNLYPDVNLDEALREPGKRGEGLLRAAIKLAGDRENIDRNVALAVYRKYKQAFDACNRQAIGFLKYQSEAEYQALHQVGEAKEKREALKKLGQELKVPLITRVDDTFKSFLTFIGIAAENIISVDSITLKRQKVFENYLEVYTKIKDKIMMASAMIIKIGLNPPAQWNLTGYIDVDKQRAEEIYNAYLNALETAKIDAIKIHKEKIGSDPMFTLQNLCDSDIRQKLASIQIRIAHTKDLQSLYFRRASVADNTHMIKTKLSESMPLDEMIKIVQEHDFSVNELEIYTEAAENLNDRIKSLEEEYAQAIKDFEKQIKECFEKQKKEEIEAVEEESVEKDKLEKEKNEKAKAEKEKLEQDKSQKEKAEKEKLEKEKSDKEKAAQEKALKEKIEKENAEKEAALNQEANVNYKFGGKVPSVWDGGSDDARFWFNRKEAEYVNPHKMCTKARAWGKLTGKLKTLYEAKSLTELTKGFPEEIKEHKRWGFKAEEKTISVGSFTGKMVETEVRFKSGSASMEGYRDSSTSVSAHGFVVKGSQVIEFNYSVYAGGCFNNTDRAFQEAQVRAGLGEVKGILGSINLVKDGKFETVPYAGPKMDGSDIPKVSLSPASLQKLKIGDAVKISAVVENAEPEDSPFTYNWTGEISGQGQSVTVAPKNSGKASVSVSVDGARFPLGSASLEYEVEDFKVSIERVPNAQAPVAIGSSIGFKASLLSGGTAANGDYVYRWQPHPEVTFADLDSTSNQTTAKFTRLGSVKVWVEVLRKDGDSLSTVAESEQIEIDVTEPKLTLTVTPPQPLVGEMVTLKVVEEPAIDDKTVSFWWEKEGNVLNVGALANEREYTYIPKDTKPVVIKVHAKGLDAGDDLGEKEITVTAKPYEITVSKPKARGVTPRIWKEGKGLVDVEQGIAVYQDVSVSAEISPASKNLPLSYEWKISPEGARVYSPGSKETTINADKTGSYNLTVLVKDSKGIELGTGKGTVSVTISQDQMDTGKKKTEETTQSFAKAKETAKQGKYDEAIKNAEETLAADPQNQEAKAILDQAKKDKTEIDQGLEKVEELIKKSEFEQAQKQFFELKNKTNYYPPIQAMEKTLRDQWSAHTAKVSAAMGDVNVKTDRRDYKEALDAIEEARKLKLLPSELKTLSDQENYLKPLEAKKENARQLFVSSKQKFEALDFQGCIDDYLQGFRLTPNMWNVNTDKTINKAEEIYRQAFAKQKELDEYSTIAKGATTIPVYPQRIKDFERGLEACAKVKELQPFNKEVLQIESQLKDIIQKLSQDNNSTTQNSGVLKTVVGSSVSENTEQTIILDKVDIENADKIRINITELSKRTFQGNNDSARIGEVEFYYKGNKIIPRSAIAESTFSGYSPEQAMDGDPQYKYYSDGAKGWASADKIAGSKTWIEFEFSPSVNIDKVVITTAPSNPYRLHSFELQASYSGSSDEPAISNDQYSAEQVDELNSFAGQWKSNWGVLDFKVEGIKVTGTYPHDQGRIEAILSTDGKTMKGYWSEAPSYKTRNDRGKVTFTLDDDKKKLSGVWGYGEDEPKSAWYGTRIGAVSVIKGKSISSVFKNIAGKYFINANGYKGVIILSESNDGPVGIMNLGKPEKLIDIHFDGTTLTFTRPIPGITQVYIGILSGSGDKLHFEGTFTSSGQTYNWFIDMQEKADFDLIGGDFKLAGKWSIVANGYGGTLILKNNDGKISGILSLGSGDEIMKDISFDGATLKFTRPIPRFNFDQVYTGKVSGTSLLLHAEGNFTQDGEGNYFWSADLVEPESIY